MTKLSELQLTTPGWQKYQHRPSVRVSTCCLLLMGLKPGAAKKAGITRWPTKSKLGRQYNSLLAQSHSLMEGKNRLLQPINGEVTNDRDEFQQLAIPFAYFVALAKSDVSPFSVILQHDLRDGFKHLSPPIPTGYPNPEDLLKELRSTYVKSEGGLVPPEHTDVDLAKEYQQLKRGDKQLHLYCGAMLQWVHEKYMLKEWNPRPNPSLNQLETELRAWLQERVAHGVAVPASGTMRKSLGLAMHAFKVGDIELKPLPASQKMEH